VGKNKDRNVRKQLKNNTKLFFEKANGIKTGIKAKSTIMKSKDGLLITEKTEVVGEFKNVFEIMLNQSTQNESGEKITTVEQYIEKPTEEEIEQVISMLKNGKVPGEDGIAAEMLKRGGKALITTLKQLIEKIWNDEKIP
jgi:UDP-3-O-acyl-N-acetylglucosamine deacetylase